VTASTQDASTKSLSRPATAAACPRARLLGIEDVFADGARAQGAPETEQDLWSPDVCNLVDDRGEHRRRPSI
jgi:hypothetical protein